MITSMKVIYYPQIGFQIALACIEGVDAQQQLHIPGTDLEYQVWFECSFFFFVLRTCLMIFYIIQFHTSQFIYFKNQRCTELDEQIG